MRFAQPRFEGKVAIVTGFGSGIGQATAVALAAEGAAIAGLSRQPEAGQASVELVQAAGGRARFISCDVRSPQDVRSAIDQTLAEYGRLDIVINSAGIRLTGTATDIGPDDWDAVIGTNLTGAFLVSRASIPSLRAGGGGAIVNVSANSGFRGNPGRVAYSASKGGLHNLTEAMALDHASDNIRVNCVAPGPTATPMMGEITPEQEARLAQRVPLGRVGQSQDVATAIAFLASDDARHITGSILSVAGGAHLT